MIFVESFQSRNRLLPESNAQLGLQHVLAKSVASSASLSSVRSTYAVATQRTPLVKILQRASAYAVSKPEDLRTEAEQQKRTLDQLSTHHLPIGPIVAAPI